MPGTLTRRSFASGLMTTAAVMAASDARAADASAVILTVTGKIAHPNRPDGSAQFSRRDLEALGHASIVTKTPWDDGRVTFTGVPMSALMTAVGAAGTRLQVHAINDYITYIPIADFSAFGVLLALQRNGQYMPVRDKGPLFIVYPYDSDSRLQYEEYYSRSAWQVDHMTVLQG